jgi:hypothetical protein
MDLTTALWAALAVAVCVAGVAWLWFHPSRHKYDPDELVTIAEFANTTDAHLWKTRLESQGVQCVLANEASSTLINTMVASDFASVRLQVLGRDFGRAKRIIGAS